MLTNPLLWPNNTIQSVSVQSLCIHCFLIKSALISSCVVIMKTVTCDHKRRILKSLHTFGMPGCHSDDRKQVAFPWRLASCSECALVSLLVSSLMLPVCLLSVCSPFSSSQTHTKAVEISWDSHKPFAASMIWLAYLLPSFPYVEARAS